MSTETLPIEYRGFVIENETDPWAKKYLGEIRLNPYGQELGEDTRTCSTVEEAKLIIDEILDTHIK